MSKTLTDRGITIILVLVFALVFGVSVLSMMSFTLMQSKLGQTKAVSQSAFAIAESGLEYYKWFLAHNPNDLTDGTGGPGPYTHSYSDPESGELGEFTLEVTGNGKCGTISSIDIKSTGSVQRDTRFKRTVSARYMQPSVANYAYIINSNVWAGEDRDIVGPYHSNGGIRMDGTNHSTVTSSIDSWLCTASFGCNPSEEKDGVWGQGEGSTLWQYPAPQIDFAGISVDLANMKDLAQNQNGIYLPRISNGDDKLGYHLILQDDGYLKVYQVDSTQYALSIHIDNTAGGWQRDYHTIASEHLLETLEIGEDCPIIYVQDKLWLEGTVSGKVTIVAADLVHANYDPNIIIEGDIAYAHSDGSDGLTAIAENSVLLPLTTASELSLRGIFVAQKGYFGRNLYPCWYSPNDKKTKLTMQGTIVSNKRVGTKWSYSTWGCWSEWSGFNNRENSYDRYLAIDPPPGTPTVSDDYQFIRWREGE